MGNYPLLFSAFRQGGLNLRNRTVMAAMNNNFSTEQGTANDRVISFIEERAKGGAGLIISEACPVSESGRHRVRSICAFDDRFIPGLKKLAEAVHSHQSCLALQLHHAGRLANEAILGFRPLAPSPIPRGPGQPPPKEMTVDEIQEVIRDFGRAARRAKQSGFDAVEIHGAHGYLIHQFMSPRTNQRKDAYGGNPEKRIRFALEVTRQVRQEVGPDYPVLFRLSAKEFAEGGYEWEEVLDWAVELEKAGISILDVSGGTNEALLTAVHVIQPMFFPPAYHAPWAAALKKVVKVPVIAVGRMDSLEIMERTLQAGQADLIASGRQFLTDPHWVIKAAQGEEDRIRPCVYCNQCVWSLFQQKDITCLQNASLGREKECQIFQAQEPKKIVVIGGGPAGLEAARVAAKRGHRVTLYEKNPHFGGQMVLASTPPRKKLLWRSIEWRIQEIMREGVEIKLDTEATVETVLEKKPDVLILATGAKPIIRTPCHDAEVLTAWEVLAGKKVGKRAVILGGGMVGIETAEFLLEKGCEVMVLTSREGMDRLATDMEGTTRALLLERLPKLKIQIRFSVQGLTISRGRVRFTAGGQEGWLDADTIVIAQGSAPNRSLGDALKDQVPQILFIGDCVEPRSAREAFHEGFLAALEI